MPKRHVHKSKGRWAWDQDMRSGKGAWFNVCACGSVVIHKNKKQSQNPN